ncbi:MAG: DUF1622 domain-containing protein [Bacteroidota bacterium]
MDEHITKIAEYAAVFIELVGIAVITGIIVYILIYAIVKSITGANKYELYKTIRKRTGYGILLGLEILVAADIIYTVAVDLNLETIGGLAIIVVIRTILSFSLEVELTGRWPWKGKSG